MTAIGLKAKTVKIGEQRAPKEIRDNTKARRAWNAATIAEVTAEAGITAKVVGKGSYEVVVVYRTTQVEGRIQLRGTCQACARSIAVEGGVMVLHGYQRPGWGYAVGSCAGTGYKPAEHDLTLTHTLIANATQRIDALTAEKAHYDALAATLPYATEEDYAAVRAAPVTIEIDGRGRRTVTPGATILRHGWQAQATKAEQRIWPQRSQVEGLTTWVLPKYGAPLAEVVKV